MNSDQIQSKFESVADKYLHTQAQEIDEKAIWPEEALRALQAEGLAGLTVPKSYGGLGGGLLSLVQASEILAKECGSAAMCFGMHCVGSAVISAKATKDQAERFLTPIVEGRHITTLALSEPGTGSHFYIPQLKMNSVGADSVELNGAKSFVTNGPHADSYVASIVAEDKSAPMGEFSMIIVPKEAKGLKWQDPWDGFGMRGNASANVEYKGVKVPQNNLLGQRGDQLWYVFEVVAPFFLMAMAGTYLGIATAALNEALSHLQQRTHAHSGSGPSHVSIIQHKVGILWSRVESARQLVYHAARLGDSSDPQALPAILSAKAEVGDCVTMVVNEAMTLVGGRGYGENGKLGRLLRDARAAHIMAPTTDMLRTWTGRALLGLPLLSEG